MSEKTVHILISVFRGCRVCVHLLYGLLLAIIYPHLGQPGQNRILKNWNRQLLAILNIGILIEGQQPVRAGCLIVANHVSWLDIIVLNAIHPSRFIAKSEVRDWPIIGWLSRRCGTVFIERALRQNAATVNRRIGQLFEQDISIGLFPEGTTTDGKQVGHFHSALIQPAIDAGIRVQPMALRYQEKGGEPGSAAVFVGEMTLAQSIWQILRCARQSVSVAFAPVLMTENTNRRVLARAAHEAISQALLTLGNVRPNAMRQALYDIPEFGISSLSACDLLGDPLLNPLPLEDS
ncbi:MAG TPA: lysophospholipid acyltransferase family protein [Gallionella sp.]|nr:lysophospholipid acyltransferase family protein [Gallionella sp.]